jgi:hypothetical protein
MISLLLKLTLATLISIEPILVLELWPGEGRPHFESTGAALTLYSKPDTDSQAALTYRPQAGRRIQWDKTEYQTKTSMTVKVVRDTTLTASSFGDIKRLTAAMYYHQNRKTEVLRLKAGEEFEYLQDRAEGACFIKIEKTVYDVEERNDAFKLNGQPTNEWWIRITENRKPLGWLLIDGAPVKHLRRTF